MMGGGMETRQSWEAAAAASSLQESAADSTAMEAAVEVALRKRLEAAADRRLEAAAVDNTGMLAAAAVAAVPAVP